MTGSTLSRITILILIIGHAALLCVVTAAPASDDPRDAALEASRLTVYFKMILADDLHASYRVSDS